jgi:plasmid stabilization system protein ParE
MPRVRLRPAAIADLAELHGHVAAEDRSAADRLVRRLVDRAGTLTEHPDRGAPRPRLGRDTRCLVEGDYLLFYVATPSEVTILRILLGARQVTRAMLRPPTAPP